MKGFSPLRSRKTRLPDLATLTRRQPERTPNLPGRDLRPTIGGQPRTTFQRRIDVTSRGPHRPVAGLSPNEQRAAQDVDAHLVTRIVIQALRDRMELFEARLPNQYPPVVMGIAVDFLITGRTPPFAFDVVNRRQPDDGYRRMVLQLYGVPYATVDEEAILRSAEDTEQELDRVLAPSAFTLLARVGIPLGQVPYEVLTRPDMVGFFHIWPPVLDYSWQLNSGDVLRLF